MAKSKKKAPEGWHAVGMDLGGTKILAAVVNESGDIVAEAKARHGSEKDPEGVIDRMGEAAGKALHKAGLEWKAIGAVAVGAPGPVDPQKGIVYHAPNLAGWTDVPLAKRLVEAFGVPAYIENDVNLGTLGEKVLGAGRGTRDMVGIFPGTGIGGGLILDGKLRSGFRSAAGEVGHMVLMPDGPVCGCGRRGCAEALASRTAIERDIRIGLATGRESVLRGQAGGKKAPLTSGVLADAVKQGDPLATEVLGRAQWYLGLLTADIVNLIDPEMVVFGGGLVEAFGDDFLEPIRVTARQYFIQQAGADRLQIVPARLGDYAVVLGAAMLARQATP
jgi:glucokinase